MEQTTLVARRSIRVAVLFGLSAAMLADYALLDLASPTERRIAAVGAAALGGVAALHLSRRRVLVVRPEGVESAPRLQRRRLLRWAQLRTAVITDAPEGATLVLRSVVRGRRSVRIRQSEVSGSVKAVVKALATAGVPVRDKIGRSSGLRRGLRRAWVIGGAVSVGVTALAAALLMPIPSRYSQVPGSVLSATAVVTPNRRVATGGDVGMVTVRTGPANLLTMLQARGDPLVQVGRRAEIVGRTPAELAREAGRQTTATAAREAVAAAWRFHGAEVEVAGAGAELLNVPPALRGELRPEDVVEAVDGVPTPTIRTFWAAVGAARDRPVPLRMRRGARHFDVIAPPRWYASEPPLVVAPAEVELRGQPVAVGVDHRGLDGNSAGLAWALAVLQDVAGMDVARGRLVVATGALSADGTVHPVGGIRQKAAAARRAGAEVFLVPAEQLVDARATAGPLRVVGVASLAQAVAVLAEHPAG